jgi:hypothetical protein
MAEFLVGADLTQVSPADFEQCSINDSSLGARPLAHAILRSRLIVVGGASSECSTSSAIDRSAIAYALLTASSFVAPYANAPGTCGISAIQRPSVSSSVSTMNRKSWLPVPCGGLRSDFIYVRMPDEETRFHLTQVTWKTTNQHIPLGENCKRLEQLIVV